MAAVIRTRITQFTQKYLFSALTQPKCVSINQKYSFHNTSFLWVIGKEVKMPSLSPTMLEGTIVKWLKKEGDPIHPGDVLCDIQTDKAVVALETDEEGILAKILVPENTSDVKVGTLIALWVAEDEDWKSVEIPPTTKAPEAPSPSASKTSSQPLPSASATPSPPSPAHPVKKSAAPQNYGPAVRLLLELYGLQVSQIKGSGRGGKVLKHDVLLFIQQNALKPKARDEVPPPTKMKAPIPGDIKTPSVQLTKPAALPGRPGNNYRDIEVSNIQREIAKRISYSKNTVPHSYGTINCIIDKMLSFRRELELNGVAVSINDFVLKAVANALEQHPEVNVLWKEEQVIPVSTVDISVAVAADTWRISPVLKNVNHKGLDQIAKEVKYLEEKARNGKLEPQEFQGGSFSVTNLGMFAVCEFSEIISPPQCAALAVGCGQEVLNEEGQAVTKMTLSLAYDNRAIDEFMAAQFLTALHDNLEHPSFLMVGHPHVANLQLR